MMKLLKQLLLLLMLTIAGTTGAWAQTNVSSEDELRNAITDGASIILTQDIALSNYLGIGDGSDFKPTVTLDLNGHTLSRNLGAADPDGHVIWILEGGTLTVKDSSGDNSGKLTGGWAYNGGGINVSKNSTLYFQSGTITGCKGSDTGGAICNKGTCYFQGGTITDCKGTDGGGIYNADAGTLYIMGGEISNNDNEGVENHGTATISGGTIKNNYGQTRGGGVWNGQSATLTITGGTFTGNRANLYGGGVFSYSSFNMSGNPVIKDNTVNGNRNNLYLDNNAVINVTEAFTEGAKVGVTLANTNRVFTSGYSTYNSGTDPISIFTYDNTDTYLSSNDDGEVILNQTQGNWIDFRSSRFSYAQTDMVRPIIHIQSEAELAYLAYLINRGENLNAGTTYEMKMGDIILERDLDMSAHFWTPIGNNEHMFGINFNGNGHTIKGIRVNSTGEGNGLFGCVLGTYKNKEGNGDIKCCEYIKNFTLKDSYIKGGNRTGGVVGYMHHQSTLENVFCQADVTGNDCVGGLVGFAEGSQYIIYYYETHYMPTIKNNLYLSGKVTGTGSCGALIGRVGEFVDCSNTYYIDPASKVGNGYNERAYPVTKSVPEGMTFSYTSTNGITYNDIPYYPAGAVNFTVKCDLNYVKKVMVNGTEVVGSEDNYSFTIDPATAETYEISVIADESGITGSGTEDDPYLIKNEEGWNFMAYYLHSGQAPNGFSGKHFKLMPPDMTISQMMGNESHPFKGIFDGDGHTLTLAFGSADNYLDQSCAPFYYIENATIKNLTVDGNIYSSAQNNAGLVRAAKNEFNYIRNCVSNVSIYSNRDGDCSNGGFIGSLNTHLTKVYFEGCAFAGELVGTNASNWGGFVGWREYKEYGKPNFNSVHFTDCLFAPKTVSIATGGNSRTFCRSRDNTTMGAYYTRCYYTEVLQVSDGGKQAYSITGGDGVTVKNAGTATEYGPSGITSYGVGIKYNNVLYAGNGDKVSLNLEGSDTGLYLTSNGVLTGGTSDTYTLTMADVNTVITAWNVTPPTEIASLEDWNKFSTSIIAGCDYANQTVTMTASVGTTENPVNTTAGLNGCSFKGTFDGGGHTLTVALNNTESNLQGVAPFCYIQDATIKGLTVAGSISSVTRHTGGIVGFANGTNTIEGCTVTATMNISSDYAGGIVGHARESNTTIKDCVFAGTFNGIDDSRNYVGAILGWCDEGAKPVLQNCLENGSYNNIASFHPMGIQAKNACTINVTDSYYLTTTFSKFKNVCAPATGFEQVYKEIPAGTVCEPVTAADGNTYYKKTTGVVLPDDEDCGEIIYESDGLTANVKLEGRTLYKDGSWNTICLPFDVTIAGSVLDGDGVKVRQLNEAASNLNDGLLTLTFEEVPGGVLKASKPYLIKWENTGSNLESPTFKDVTFTTSMPGFDIFDGGFWQGNFSPVFIDEDNIDEILLLSADNKMGYSQEPRMLHNFRAHVEITAESDEDGVFGARAVTRSIIDFGDGETTGIIEVKSGEVRSEKFDDGWYDLQGRKLNGEPVRAGVYIHKGKKVKK